MLSIVTYGFSFHGYAVHLAEPFYPKIRYVAPVRVTGPVTCNILAVWAQNGSGGVSRTHQLGPNSWPDSARGF